MSKEDEERHAAIVEFLRSFPNVSIPPSDLSELGDGVAMFEALSEIAPDHFDASTIARDLGHNWALKSSNLRKLIRNLETFYHEVLFQDADFEEVVASVSSIARLSDRVAIANLFELIAAAAVTCEHRGKFVGRIMNMSPTNQIQMKGIVESSLSRLCEYDSPDRTAGSDEGGESELAFYSDEDNDSNGSTPTTDEVTSLFNSAMADINSVSREYDMDPSARPNGFLSASKSNSIELTKERDELRSALQDARRELSAYKSQATTFSEDTESTRKKLRALAEDLQERLERRQVELTAAEDELSKTKLALEDTNSKAADFAERNAVLADELDVAIAKANQLRKAEATVVAYRKKLEGVGVMNQQMTELEDQAAAYLRQIMDLEAETKKVPELQKTIEELQRKVAKIEKERMEADESIKAKVSEISRLKTDVSAAEVAKKMYANELSDLRSQHDGPDAPPEDDLGLAIRDISFTSAKSVSEANERALRLQIENQSLKEEIEKLRSNSEGQVQAGYDVKDFQEEISRLKADLKKKEAEKDKLGSDKEKLEAYTKKTLSKFQEKYLVALQECKAKLKEKHDKIEALEMRSSAEKAAQKREERLLSSTIYELGLGIMQQRLKDR